MGSTAVPPDTAGPQGGQKENRVEPYLANATHCYRPRLKESANLICRSIRDLRFGEKKIEAQSCIINCLLTSQWRTESIFSLSHTIHTTYTYTGTHTCTHANTHTHAQALFCSVSLWS